ncbi:MAG: 7-carboxy-7-deazaguanine synthase QueE [bacterium]
MPAKLNEIFSSIQGEGMYVGERQIFVRFVGCNLTCGYCDTPAKNEGKLTSAEELVESVPRQGSECLEWRACRAISLLDTQKGLHHSISLTGGEPLLQVEFLKSFIPLLKEQLKLPIYLETNGTLPDHLTEIIELVDIISMDIKLPSATGLSPYWKEHRRFLETAYLKEVFVKIVFTKETTMKDLEEGVKIIAEVDENIPLILQPATAHRHVKPPEAVKILAFQALAKRKLKQVRVIPQIHKLLGLR